MPELYQFRRVASFSGSKQFCLSLAFRQSKPKDMTLDTYLSREGAKTLTALSIETGVSKGRLSQLRHATDWPPELALRIEKATAGAMSASKLCSVIANARLPEVMAVPAADASQAAA